MIKLVPVKHEEREMFRNINQKYLYEMTNFYPDVMDEEGNYLFELPKMEKKSSRLEELKVEHK